MSNGTTKTKSLLPGEILTGESRSLKDSKTSPRSIVGSPFIRRVPITVPTATSSLARKFSADPPPSR